MRDECDEYQKISDKVSEIHDTVDQINCNVVVLMGTIPTLATKEELYSTREDVSSVRALAIENKQTKNYIYWTLSIAIAVATFLVGYSF